MKPRRYLQVLALMTGLLAFSGAAHADTFTLSGPISLSGQGYGTIFTILSLHHNEEQNLMAETGAVAPTIAENLATLDANFGGCSVHSGIELCGNATNQSAVMTAADLASRGFTSTSTFALMYNVNQQGVDLNTTLHAPDPFTVYFYDEEGNVLFAASYAGTNDPFPPIGQNGQGTDGYLFVLEGTQFGSNFSDIAYIGMSGTAGNSNDGADNWSVVPGAGTPVPEPATLVLLGTGLVGLGAKLRRRIKKS